MKENINVDLSMAKDVVCEGCGNYSFEQVVLMKRLSALMSPTGKEGIVPIPVFACNACGYINREFLPTMMRDLDNQQEEDVDLDEGVEEDTKPKLTIVQD